MRIKMIATDLHSTLLKNDKTVSDYTVSVFKRLRERGILVAFATARPVRTVKGMNVRITCDAVVYHNGALVSAGGAAIHRAGVEFGTAKGILLAASENFKGLNISVEINDTLYANFDVSIIWSGAPCVVSDFLNLPEYPADKIIFDTADAGVIEEIKKILPPGLYAQVSENKILLVMNENASKLNGLKKIAEHYGIPMSDIVSFGDDLNDVGMLESCGTGVAVANAVYEAKAAADFVCGANEDDGVAKWIDERILR